MWSVLHAPSGGAAFGDFGNDGDLDILVACNNQPAILLRNDSPRRSHWIWVTLIGHSRNRDALGARVRVTTGSLTQTQYVPSGSSYLADHDRRLLFGIGAAAETKVEIRWPCGTVQTLDARGYLPLRAGEPLQAPDRHSPPLIPAEIKTGRATAARPSRRRPPASPRT